MFDKNTYDKIKEFLGKYVEPFLADFFNGLFWFFTRMESKAAGLGFFVALVLILTISTVVGLVTLMSIFPSSDSGSGNISNVVSDITSSGTSTGNDNCNVVGIEIRDCIYTYKPDAENNPPSDGMNYCDTITSSEDVTWALEDAANNPKIKAVVLEIDSGGGSPAAAEEISAAMKALGKPSIAWVRENADSAAYWIASAADTVIAGENSDIGSIGVTMSYVDNAKQNLKDGLTYNQLTTGKYKDTGTADRALTADERSLIQRDLDIVLQNFIRAVATNRNLSVAKVTALADGSSMLGRQALRNGLIDQIGTKQEVWKKLEADIGEKPDVCWN